MDFATIIKQSVSMADVCNIYGIPVNHAGFCSCPWHGTDKHPSMKIYDGDRGYHCFTCGIGGDCIDFVSKYFGLSFQEAIKKINSDFGLNLPLNSAKSSQEYAKMSHEVEQKRAERAKIAEIQTKLQNEYDYALDYFATFDRAKTAFKPKCKENASTYAYILAEYEFAKYQLSEAEARLRYFEDKNH